MTKCLLALSSLSILGTAVEHLLSATRELDLVSLSIQDRSELVESIQKVQPDVVIVEGNGITNEDFLASLLTIQPDLLVIQVESDDNQLQIYQHQHISIRETSEFITLIQSH